MGFRPKKNKFLFLKLVFSSIFDLRYEVLLRLRLIVAFAQCCCIAVGLRAHVLIYCNGIEDIIWYG
jgi:hypothetical protein